MTEVAIVVLNFNGKKYLEKFLPKLQAYSGHPIYVVDNGSVDDSEAFVKDRFPDIHIIRFRENHGFTGGYNLALREVKADIFILLNTDIEVSPNWIDPCIDLIQSDLSIAACQPKLLSYHDRGKFEYAGAAGGYIDFLGFPFCRGRLFQNMEKDRNQYNDNVQVFWASGACLFIRRDVFFEVGGFDEDFFAHMEEIDMCWRIQNAGYKIYYCGESHIFHMGGGTLSKSNPRKTYLNFRNGLTMLVKNELPGKLWWKLPVRTIFDMMAMVKFTFFDSIKDGLAVLKAHLHFWFHMGPILKKRRKVKLARNSSAEVQKTIYPNSIVLDYFLRGKKRFDSLNFTFQKSENASGN